MAKRTIGKARLPRIPFRFGGPKPTARQLSEFRFLLDLPEEYLRFLKWRIGGTPALTYFTWTHPADGSIISRVDQFFGFDPGGVDARRSTDTIWAILRFRHWLPRWSIPVAFVDEHSFLVTFPRGDREDQAWLKRWCHDAPDDDASPEEDCYFVAASVPRLVAMLRGGAAED